jgi:uncharacterized protein YkwD
MDIAKIENRTMRLLNEYRTGKGLTPFRFDPTLATLARAHSQDMARGRVPFGHEGFAKRVARSGRESDAAENVVFTPNGQDAAAQALQIWIDSSGHRVNLDGSRVVSGIGAAQSNDGNVYITQLFFRN